MRNIIYGAVLATLVLLSLAFTNWTAPARHPIQGGSADFPSSIGLLMQVASGSSTSPIFRPTAYAPPLLEISTGLGTGTLLATGTVYGGGVLFSSTRLTAMSLYVSVASSNTAANQVLTVTDGTNTCTFSFACNGSSGVGSGGTLTTGVTSVSGVDGAGDGCTFPLSSGGGAGVSVSTTTQGCGTAATIKNIVLYGVPQG